MTNSETKNFSQNVSSSYHLGGECSDEYKKDSLNVPKLRFEGYNEEWVEKRIEKVLKIKHGKDKKAIETQDGRYPILATSGEIGRSNTFLWNKPCVLIGRKGTINKPQYMDIPFWTVDTLFYSDVFQENNAKYLYYLFNTINWEKYDESTGVPSLSAKTIERIKIKISNNAQEQEKIASFLTLIDKKIEKQKELVELLKKYKRGLLSQIFSQKLRFKDENGNNYPDWEEKRLGDICTTFSGGTPSITHQEYYNGDIPFIKSGEIHSDKTEMFITDIGLKNSSAKLVKKGDLLFALYGATSGEVDISKINGAINQAILCVKSDTLNLNYLKELLSYNKNQILCKYLQGGQGNLSADIFKALKFKFPIKKEQDKISDFLINYDKITHIEEHLLNLYINYKQGLLQQLFI